MTDNKPTEYSLSRADEPATGRGTPMSDLRVDLQPPKQPHTPHTVLRDMLRSAEAEHAYNQKRRNRKLFWYLFRVFFFALSVFMFFYFVGTLSPQSFMEYLGIAVECAFCGAIFALILAAIGRPIHTSAHNTCFADEFVELYEIEKIKDNMCQ